jgi:hypothetical protein
MRVIPSNDAVFINCPFDAEYEPLLRVLLFTVIRCGLHPRIARERLESAEPRISKLVELIKDTRWGIHDLSRIKAKKKGEFYRMNMPFELGLDIGAKIFSKNHEDKKVLIIAEKPFDHQIGLSDLSNSDIRYHKSDAETLTHEVRNWFRESGLNSLPPGSRVWDDFNAFMSDFEIKRAMEGYKDADIRNMPVPEFLDFIKRWVAEYCD